MLATASCSARALIPPSVATRKRRSAIESPIIDESVVRHMIPQLKAAGATGIVEYSINKIID